MKKAQTKAVSRVGISQAARDVLVAAINKGQLPIVSVSLIFIAAILKMPAEDVSKFMFRLIEVTENGRIAGYSMSLVFLVAWYTHTRFQRRAFTKEMDRISSERTHLQADALGNRVKSSEGT